MRTKFQLLVAGMFLATTGTGLGQPIITNQPQDQTSVVGTTATFTVGATGTEPLAYQWQKSLDLATFTDRPGDTTATLVITNVQTADQAYYRVVVTNLEGAVTSSVANLYVIVPPSISSSGQPTNFPSASLGATVGNRVDASGSRPLSYQWRLNGTDLPGQTRTSISLSNLKASDSGDYTVVVTNLAGAVTSQVARLDVDLVFTKITEGSLVTDGMDDHAVAWGDCNGDGSLDVVTTGGYWWSSSANISALYTNRGDGSFARATPSPFTTSANALCVNWADPDNDGDLDLWLGVNEASAPQYFTNRGNGTFTRLLANATWIENGGRLRGSAQAWADYDADGLVDLVVVPRGESAATTGPLSLLHNLGNGRFEVVTNSPLYEVNKFSSLVSWVDFDNDGHPDLLCGGDSPVAFHNDGGTLVPWPEGDALRNANMDAWGDFDNDGIQEVLVTVYGSPPRLWRNNYPNGWTLLDGPLYQALKNVPTSTEGDCAAWGDYDNDGDLDLFVATGHVDFLANRNHLFRNDGPAGFTEVFAGSLVIDQARSSRCVWVDYDNNGFLDLHVVNSSPSSATSLNDFLYRNNGNSNNWLEVKLVGQLSNRSAIGAKVRVKAIIGGKEVWQLRTISAQAWTQELMAHFGLGTADRAEIVRIEWPSGIEQELVSVAGGQILSIEEEVLPITSSQPESKPGVVEVIKGGAVTLNLSSVPPNATLQWQFGGEDIPGATNANLLIASLSAADLGEYSIVVTTPALKVSSRPISVLMQGAPVIVSGPWAVTPRTVSVGVPVVLRAVIEGTPSPTCQWQLNGVDIPAATNPTATTPELRINAASVADSGDYRLVASNVVDAVSSATVAIHVDATFVRINDGPGGNDRDDSVGAAWGDFDKDGYPDLFIANNWASATRNAFWRNNGDGTFTKLTNNAPALATGYWCHAYWTDFDNDGDLDLHVIGFGEAADRFYRNDGNGVFTPVTPEFVKLPSSGEMLSWSDFDNDGWLDVVIPRQNGNGLFYRNRSDGTFQSMTTNEVGSLVAKPSYCVGATFDYDDDGWQDLLIDPLAVGANCRLFHNEGQAFFRQITEGDLANQPSWLDWPVLFAAGDYDNDGDFDLLATSGEDGYRGRLYRNEGNGVFTNVAAAAGVDLPLNAFFSRWGDFDNDGDLDLFIVCENYGRPTPVASNDSVMFRNNGDGTFTSIDIGSPLRDGVRRGSPTWVDYDNDGFLDFFLTCGNGEPQRNYLYRNNLPAVGNTNHWLKVHLAGKASNTMGVGAKVRVTASIRGKTVQQVRQIATPGSLADEALVAHFGLGDATNVTTLRIEWPSGIVQELTSVAANQSLTVTEHQAGATDSPSLAASPSAGGTLQLTATGQTNLRYVFEASTNLVQWTKIAVRENLTGTVDYTPPPSSTPQRFYRVVVP